MKNFHDILDQVTKRRKIELQGMIEKEVNPDIQAVYAQEIADLTMFIYCCQAVAPLDAPLDKAAIVPLQKP